MAFYAQNERGGGVPDHWDPATYGDCIAEVYDEWYGEAFDTEGAVDALAALAGGGPVLELGIGTGRVALPLAARGLEVHGVDASVVMLDRLRAKPGGDRIAVAVGDIADVPAPAPGRAYRLVFSAFNTFFGVTTAEGQARAVARAAERLAAGGRFVVEAFVPDLDRYERDQRVAARRVGLDEVVLDVSRHDPVAQRVLTQQVVLRDDGVRLYPSLIRYATPAQLDELAAFAGLSLEHRWSNWRRAPFEDDSPFHVSVWRRGGGDT